MDPPIRVERMLFVFCVSGEKPMIFADVKEHTKSICLIDLIELI